MMAKCEKCSLEILNEDLYEDHGIKVCEECKMKTAVSAPQSCASTKNMIK